MGRSRCGQQGLRDRLAAIADRHRGTDQVATAAAEDQLAKTADTIVNNGHTIQLNFADGSTLTLGDKIFKLLQVHFHHPSEHMVAGKSFPMEAHFVHRADSGALAVVGVLMSTGKPNASFARVVATMPAREGPPVKADAGFNPNDMLPKKLSYYRYPGSLTTPPCAETVEWLVLTTPITVAESVCKTLSAQRAAGAAR